MRCSVTIVLLGLIFSPTTDREVAAAADPQAREPATQPPRGYVSPQAAYDAYRTACQQRDWRTFFACHAPWAQDDLASGAPLLLVFLGDLKRAVAILDKYRVDSTAEKQAHCSVQFSDKATMFEEAMAAACKLGFDPPPLGDLTLLSLDATRATGKARTVTDVHTWGFAEGWTRKKKVTYLEIEFWRLDGRWFVSHGPPPPPPPPPEGHDSPQAAFDAYRKARAEKNWRALFSCHTPRRQDDLLIRSLFNLIIRDYQQFKTILRRHCVDTTALEAARSGKNVDHEAVWKAMLGQMLFKVMVFEEVREALDRPDSTPSPLGELEMLNVRGTRATGKAKIVVSFHSWGPERDGQGRELKQHRELTQYQEFHFRQLNGRWYLSDAPPPPESEEDDDTAEAP